MEPERKLERKTRHRGGAGLPARLWSRLAGWQQGVFVLAIGVIGFSAMYWLRPSATELVPPRQIPVVTTRPVEIGEGAIQVRGSGTVRASAETTVASQVGGRVVWVAPEFVSGGRLARGEPLFRIDPADYQNALAAAEADVAQRSVGVLEAEEEVALAREEYSRLARREGLDPDPVNAAALVLREPQLLAARAALRSAEARREDARLALDRTWVRAPFDGIVRTEAVDIGQFISPGQAVGQLYATDVVEVVIPFSDDEAALVAGLWEARSSRPETRIAARIEAEFGGRRFEWAAHVDRAEAALDEETRTIDVIIRVPDPFVPTPGQPDRPPLLIGAFAIADIEGARYDRYAVVPSAAVRDEGVVWVVESDTLLAMRPVQIIQRVEDRTFVLGDLAPGEPVIISGLPFVTDGMTVRVAGGLETAGGADR